jgi:hypothetical protein
VLYKRSNSTPGTCRFRFQVALLFQQCSVVFVGIGRSRQMVRGQLLILLGYCVDACLFWLLSALSISIDSRLLRSAAALQKAPESLGLMEIQHEARFGGLQQIL